MKRILALSFLLCLPFCILAYADLSKGAKGPAVEELQQVLINQGYLDDAADGIYGDKTEAAVSAFQKSNGLQENGIVDGETQTAIYRQEKNRLERVVLSNGSTGYDVIQLQVRLIELGYLSGTASGVFDDECEVALIQFQAENGLNTTGVADKAVRDLLFPSSVSESGNSLFKEVAKITANWDWSMIGIVATVVGSLVAIINLSYSFTETARKRRQARYYIRNNAATAKRAMSTPVFPCSTINEGRIIIPYVKDFYYSKIQIHCANDGKKYAPSKLRDSFMLNGDSGCGKTAVMRERFKNTERWSKIIRSIGVLYYERSIITVPIIDSNERQLLLQSIRDASFSRLYLYIDGADEQITEAQLENLREFINLVSTHTKKIILRISTRSYFRAAITVELGPYLQRQYSIDKWNKNELKGFINEVLKRLRKKDKAGLFKNQDFFQESVELSRSILFSARLQASHI